MKYWETAFDRRAQGQQVRKNSNLFHLKHRFTEQSNGIIKTFSLAKDHTVLRRNAMGTELWTINYDNVVLSRMKEQNNLQVRLSGTKSWTRRTFNLTTNSGFSVLAKEKKFKKGMLEKENTDKVLMDLVYSAGAGLGPLWEASFSTFVCDLSHSLPHYTELLIFATRIPYHFYTHHNGTACCFSSHRVGNSQDNKKLREKKATCLKVVFIPEMKQLHFFSC